MRFVAPGRSTVDPARAAHPAFAPYAAHRDLITTPAWPGLDELNARLAARRHPHSGAALRFAAQTPALQGDGLHYETRIFERGAIATRVGNWHDLLNALAWIAFPALKAALNRRQVEDVARVGPAQRTRAQCALTHFDEGGAIVVLRDPALQAAWDAHDWPALFCTNRCAWLSNGRAQPASIVVFGHALLEHMLVPDQTVVAKCIAVVAASDAGECVGAVADAIAHGRLLCDPQELRPLPLSGISGWDTRAEDPQFVRDAPCFRPLRSGRRYPAPVAIGPS